MKHKSFSLPSWLLPLLLMLLGSTLRLACLGSVPGGIHQDESLDAHSLSGIEWRSYQSHFEPSASGNRKYFYSLGNILFIKAYV